MKTCYMYYILSLKDGQYIDNGENVLCEFTVRKELNEYKVALLGKDNNIEMLRIGIPGLIEDDIPEDSLNAIQEIKEHMFSIFNIIDKSMEMIRVWNFIEEGKPPSLSMTIQDWTANIDYKKVFELFSATWKNRVLIKLFYESIDERIPLNYRYLSLYRLLEMIYKEKGKWNNNYYLLLEGYTDKFNLLKKTKHSLEKYIEIMRNKCAHGKFVYKKEDETGLTHFNNEGLAELDIFLKLMIDITKCAVNKHPMTVGKFFLGELKNNNIK
jgi:hypothetical protein